MFLLYFVLNSTAICFGSKWQLVCTTQVWPLICEKPLRESMMTKIYSAMYSIPKQQWVRGTVYDYWNCNEIIIPSRWRPFHDDVIKWKHFPRYWPFVRGIHRSPVNSPHKGQWRGALMFSLICTRINGWVNQWWGWRFETQSFPLWRHRNAVTDCSAQKTPVISDLWLIARL